MDERVAVLSPAPAGVVELARRLLGDVDRLTSTLVEAIWAEDPSYATGRTSREDLQRSCHDNIADLLRTLTGEQEASALDAPVKTGQRRAAQGVPLDAVLHAYRLGHRTVWDALVEQAREDGTLEALVEAASWVWERVDAYSSAVATAYREHEQHRVRQDDHRRAALLDALLEGRGHDRYVAAAAADGLELPEHGPYVVLAVAGDRTLVADLLTVRGARSAWRSRHDREIGVVALGPLAPEDLLRALRALPQLTSGVSPLVEGLASVDDGARAAELALRTLAGACGTASLDERLPAALLASSPDLAQRLVQRTLGAVLALEEPERDLLLETLAAWLDTGGSAGQTATRLYCHRNTVLNRVRRLEALTGRSAERTADLVEWSLALTAREVAAREVAARDVAAGQRP